MNRIAGEPTYAMPRELEPLWRQLRAPNSGTELILFPTRAAAGVVTDGQIYTCREMERVGGYHQFQFDFRLDISANAPQTVMPETIEVLDRTKRRAFERVSHRDERLRYVGTWIDDGGNHLAPGESAAETHLVADSTGFRVTLLHYPWGGRADVYVDGRLVEEIDTYQPFESSEEETFVVEGLSSGQHDLRIVVARARHPEAKGMQIRLVSVAAETGPLENVRYTRPTGGLANAFPPRFIELLSQAGRDALVLDCGGGRRQIDDSRFFNFEYGRSEFPNVFGDAHALPFAENSFDLILSQAVMEHMRQPFVAAAELIRVCKPGGIIYVESAFMQPAHCRPIHFFNTTIWGIKELFANAHIEDAGSFGNLDELLGWIESYVSAARSQPKTRESLIAAARELHLLATDEERAFFAMGVFVQVRKRPPGDAR